MNSSYHLDAQSAAQKAVSVIGYGYDLANDVRLLYCKPGPEGSPLIQLDRNLTRDLAFPGGIVVPNVSKSITSDKGERTRIGSDVVSFHQMSEQFNQELSLSGKIPCGLFNSMFNFQGIWQKDATSTKNLAYDGWFITLYNIALARPQIVLNEHVKREVPASWDPASLARFIEKYGTHIIIGVKMGGKEVIHLKQLQNSTLEPSEVQKLLKELADVTFVEDVNGRISLSSNEFSKKVKDKQSRTLERNGPFANSIRPNVFHSKKEDIVSIHVRRGGIERGQNHNQWLSTISQSPDVISMSFVPIISLLGGVTGGGFLTHAVNLYLRYKPPIEELHQFLEFQLPRQWAPMYGDLALGLRWKKNRTPSLQFTFMGPKLHVNTEQVDSKNRPVTGMRLYLEGKKNDQLAIHLQHLTSLPKVFQLTDFVSYEVNEDIPSERGYFEPIKWSILSHVCTAPVQYNGSRIDDLSASIVTKAWFEVKDVGIRKVLFLRLGFSTLSSAKIRRSLWDGPNVQSRKSGSISLLFSTRFSSGLAQPEKPDKVELNSAVYPGGPPMPSKMPRLSKFVDTKEMVRGPEDTPGYWVVTGGKLCVEDNKISLKVKYSLLFFNSDEELD